MIDTISIPKFGRKVEYLMMKKDGKIYISSEVGIEKIYGGKYPDSEFIWRGTVKEFLNVKLKDLR